MPNEVHGIKLNLNAKKKIKIKNQNILCTRFYNKLKQGIQKFRVQQLIKINISINNSTRLLTFQKKIHLAYLKNLILCSRMDEEDL